LALGALAVLAGARDGRVVTLWPAILGLGPLLGLTVDPETLSELRGAITRLEAGETDIDVTSEREDELGALTTAIRELSASLEEREQHRERSEQYRRALHDITADTERRSPEKRQALLELGCEFLDVADGFVTRIDTDTGEYEVEQAAGSGFVEAGMQTVVSNTFCRNTIESDALLSVYSASQLGLERDPAHEEWGVSCYLGGKLLVEDELYGTLCFQDLTPREQPFCHEEKTFVDLITRWVSHALEREAHQREIRLKNRAMDSAPIGITLSDPTQDDNPLVYLNDAFERITGYGRAESLGRNCRFLQGEETSEDAANQLREAIDTETPTTVELQNYRPDGTAFWNRVSVGPVTDESGELQRFVGFQQDVTAQVETEQTLSEQQDLLHAETTESVARLVVEAAHEVLDVPGVALYQLDAEANELEGLATTEDFQTLCEDSTPVRAGNTDSLLWTSFLTETRTIFDGTDTDGDRTVFGTEIEHGLLVPLGSHGVFVLASPEPNRIDEKTRQLAETLGATTEAAFDRLDSEASVREHEAELAERTERLSRQMQVTEIIRRIHQSLIGAESREAVETAVCETLLSAETVAFAWIATRDSKGGLTPRATAGSGDTYLDAISFEGDLEPAAPTVTVANTTESLLVANVVEELQTEPWRQAALTSDFRSVVSVPLVFEGFDYGVLSVYASEANAFADLERAVFEELGASIANAISDVETRQALHSETLVELALEIDAPETLLAQLARETGTQISYDHLATHSSDAARVFFSVSGADADDIEAALEERIAVSDARRIDADGETRRFEATTSGDVLAAVLVELDGSPQSITATPDTLESVVHVSPRTDVRGFLDRLEDRTGESVELLTRQTVQREVTEGEHVSGLFEELTERQREVLETAYFAGFFEWPRSSTGEAVAEMLGVSQPTVNRHLRLSQQRLLAQLLDSESSPDC